MNQELSTILYFLCTSLIAGLAGTAAMTLFMWCVTRSGITNANMVQAIGSIFTKTVESALLVGTILHVISGFFWGMLYTIVFNFIGVHGLWALTAVGTAFGFAHGFVLSFFLVASVAEHHPLPEFRDAGIFVAVAHLVGHVIFGAVVGFAVGMSGFSVAG